MPHRAKIIEQAEKAARLQRADYGVLASLIFVALFFVGTGLISYSNISTLNQNARQVAQTHEVILSLNELLSTVKDAETGQRGYLLTGQDTYLTPYTEAVLAVKERTAAVDNLIKGSSTQEARMVSLKYRVNSKLTELEDTVALRRTQGFDAAASVVRTDKGKADMDQVRVLVAAMQSEERTRRSQRLEEMKAAYTTAVVAVVLTAISGLILTLIIAYLVRRAAEAARRQEWIQAGEVGLSAAAMGEQRVDELGRSLLSYLAEYTGARAGAVFIKDGAILKQVATFGVAGGSDVPDTVKIGEGLVGQVAADGKAVHLIDLPETHLAVGTALGQWRPRHVVVAPAASEGLIDGVIELGFLTPVDNTVLMLMERVAEFVSMAMRSANYRAMQQNLLEETQRQSEELQTQSEELRVNNEELEEQSRALKESHLRLEQQQAELEQTNVQLSEQTRMLELQKDDLNRSAADIMAKAQELEQASRYKSDFLANMSHELRTPLNSSLILAKLLADNRDGNLTEEQVKFARTIQSSGNDLLALINDILDLSKIEAGQMDITAEPVSFRRLASDMTRMFEPLANEKKLSFRVEADENLPELFDSDRQRLEQVLKNLLSNALKFTESGSVVLRISDDDGKVRFAVTDTGIGISEEQQRSIFEAFRQADSTISRKYGGTGLGLSISRELSRLLGGHIELQSEPGQGSTFTLVLPLVYDPQQVAPRDIPLAAPRPPVIETFAETPAAPDLPARPRIPDDRDRLSGDKRLLLAVEDDPSFARILYELAQDLGFQCMIATTAEDAMLIVRQYTPAAVVLDVGLPDHSGLSVLDRLKRDPKTRHIPVHVVSANDYMHAALSMGAIGYMLKPVKREELVDAFTQLETRLEKRMRRVLIVEDDEVQRDSVMALLKTQDVETVAVGTAAECLSELKEHTYDCMVLDLSLPDASGYALLETLSSEQDYAFPPVIVYTGRELSSADEQKLRRYSKSIIIKGAKSPERLLDEVTLFLHQMVSDLSPEQQKMLHKAKGRDNMLEGRRLLVVEDDVRNIYAVTNIFEPLGAIVQIARNGREALDALEAAQASPDTAVDLVLMDVMMPEMDGLTATREIRKRPEWKKLPVIMLTAKAMKDDQERCLEAGANDYMAKPLDVEKLVSLVRVWVPR
ncbi:response regulator [Asticcacaulis sp. AND118]|uniref:response regulator n=1 Tax=Asticcacaulis sp. AND118 TaxID=2840468 RepID=UPI001CFFF14B|nr:response regulator [Asticcacaulis sp. AND118]UDF04110.1 response regulator [Asticcacaulis sp. AND118]